MAILNMQQDELRLINNTWSARCLRPCKMHINHNWLLSCTRYFAFAYICTRLHAFWNRFSIWYMTESGSTNRYCFYFLAAPLSCLTRAPLLIVLPMTCLLMKGAVTGELWLYRLFIKMEKRREMVRMLCRTYTQFLTK